MTNEKEMSSLFDFKINNAAMLTKINLELDVSGKPILDLNDLAKNYSTRTCALIIDSKSVMKIWGYDSFKHTNDYQLMCIGYIGTCNEYHVFSDLYFAEQTLPVNVGVNLVRWASDDIELIIADNETKALRPLDADFVLDSTETTTKHIEKVQSYCAAFAADILHRGAIHDLSKLQEPEKAHLDRMEYITKTYGNAPYGSYEYKSRLKTLKGFTEHHYRSNSHHPEHYANGIEEMSLLDIVEMLQDWKAASERNGDSAIMLTACVRRFHIVPQLENILKAECERKGWSYE